MDKNKPLCIFGIMNNREGLTIANEMLSWLKPAYNVYEITHDGTEFEYPALHRMQLICEDLEPETPVLYIHTRGAVNQYSTTVPSRKMWQQEFGHQGQKYIDIINTYTPTVATPFWTAYGETMYNGFMANAKAMQIIPPITKNTDRFYFEKLFNDNPYVRVIGTLFHKEADKEKIKDYLFRNYQ